MPEPTSPLRTDPAAAPSAATPPGRALLPLHWVVLGCVGLAVLSLLIPAGVTYDPLAWLVWGREVLHLNLDTRGMGPAWKPLPVLADVVFTPLGPLAPYAWMVLARTGALLALALTYRLATTLAGRAAGVLAAAFLFFSTGWVGDLAVPGMSEPLLAALVLLALDLHLRGRPYGALAALFAAGLLRPEVWPLLAGYGLFLFLRRRGERLRLAGVGTLIVLGQAVLWFGGEWWGSGNPLRSSERAGVPTQGGPRLTSFPGGAVVESMGGYLPLLAWPGVVLGLVAAALAWRHRDSRLLAVIGLALAWVLIVAVMTQVGVSSGDLRYLVVAAALGSVVAGAGWVWAWSSAGAGVALGRRWVALATVGIVAIGLTWSDTWGRVGDLDYQLEGRRHEAALHRGLHDMLDQLGRDFLVGCPTPGGPVVVTGAYEVTFVAYALDLSLPQVGLDVPAAGTVIRSRETGGPATPPQYQSVPLAGEAAQEWEVLRTCPIGGQ